MWKISIGGFVGGHADADPRQREHGEAEPENSPTTGNRHKTPEQRGQVTRQSSYSVALCTTASRGVAQSVVLRSTLECPLGYVLEDRTPEETCGALAVRCGNRINSESSS